MRIAGCLLFALLSSAAAAEDVYRTVEANGNIVYSDRPLNERSVLVTIATQRPTTSAATAGGNSSAAAPAGADGASAAAPPPPAPLPDGPTAAEMRAQRLENCAIARERQERFALSSRLYRETPDGEREYLSDTEIEETRAKAATDVTNWCD